MKKTFIGLLMIAAFGLAAAAQTPAKKHDHKTDVVQPTVVFVPTACRDAVATSTGATVVAGNGSAVKTASWDGKSVDPGCQAVAP